MAQRSTEPLLQHLYKLLGHPETESLTDRQLLERFATEHAEAAFSVLVQRHGPMVLGLCRRLLHDFHDAEDAFQATFLVLARRARSVRWQESIANWLYGVAFRVASRVRQDARRHRGQERNGFAFLELVPDARQEEPASEAVRSELVKLLDAVVHGLPTKYRAPLVLCDLEGKSHTEAARSLGWPLGSISRRLARARELLREGLQRRGVCPSLPTLTTLLADKTWRVPVGGAVCETTARAAALYATGSVVTTGILSARILSLAEGVLKTMMYTQWKVLAVVLLAVGAIGAGAGGVLHVQRQAERQQAADPKPIGQSVANAELAVPEVNANGPMVGADDPKERRVRQTQQEEIRLKLKERINLERGIDPQTPLRDVMESLTDRYDVPILIDWNAFYAERPPKEVDALTVQAPKMTVMPLSAVLRLLLDQIEATYLVQAGHLRVVPLSRSRPEDWLSGSRRLAPLVQNEFKDSPLEEALRELTDETGISIMLDRKALDKAGPQRVTATLNGVPLDTAVRLLADMSGLKAVALDSVLYVTSKENADLLQAEQERRRALREQQTAAQDTKEAQEKKPASEARKKSNE